MKRILAIVTIIILVGLYITTLVAAITGAGTGNTLFMASLMASVILPVLLFAVFHTYDWLKAHGERKAVKIAAEANNASSEASNDSNATE